MVRPKKTPKIGDNTTKGCNAYYYVTTSCLLLSVILKTKFKRMRLNLWADRADRASDVTVAAVPVHIARIEAQVVSVAAVVRIERT